MILSKALTPGLHKCLMFKPSRSTRQVQELDLRETKRKISIISKFSLPNTLKCGAPSACFGYSCFTSLLCAACKHWSLRGVQWSLCTLPHRHFRFQIKVQFIWSQKKTLSTVSPNIKPLLLLGDQWSGHAAALKQFNIHSADFLLTQSTVVPIHIKANSVVRSQWRKPFL